MAVTRQAWLQDHLSEARRHNDLGRVQTALSLISDLERSPDVDSLRLNLEEKYSRFERYLRECRDYLATIRALAFNVSRWATGVAAAWGRGMFCWS